MQDRLSLRGFLLLMFALVCQPIWAQSSGTIEGVVKDPTGAVVPGVTVEIHNPVSRFDRSTTTDASGGFRFSSVPFNPYHLSIEVKQFDTYSQDVEVRSVVPVSVPINLKLKGATTTVLVEAAGELLENEPTFHTDVDRNLFDKLPLEGLSTSRQRGPV